MVNPGRSSRRNSHATLLFFCTRLATFISVSATFLWQMLSSSPLLTFPVPRSAKAALIRVALFYLVLVFSWLLFVSLFFPFPFSVFEGWSKEVASPCRCFPFPACFAPCEALQIPTARTDTAAVMHAAWSEKRRNVRHSLYMQTWNKFLMMNPLVSCTVE